MCDISNNMVQGYFNHIFDREVVASLYNFYKSIMQI